MNKYFFILIEAGSDIGAASKCDVNLVQLSISDAKLICHRHISTWCPIDAENPPIFLMLIYINLPTFDCNWNAPKTNKWSNPFVQWEHIAIRGTHKMTNQFVNFISCLLCLSVLPFLLYCNDTTNKVIAFDFDLNEVLNKTAKNNDDYDQMFIYRTPIQHFRFFSLFIRSFILFVFI